MMDVYERLAGIYEIVSCTYYMSTNMLEFVNLLLLILWTLPMYVWANLLLCILGVTRFDVFGHLRGFFLFFIFICEDKGFELKDC